VQKDIAEGKVTPGKFFVLKIDFSGINRIDGGIHQALKSRLSSSFSMFYITYASYLGGNVSKLLEKINYDDPAATLTNCVLTVSEALRSPTNGDELSDIQGVDNEFILI